MRIFQLFCMLLTLNYRFILYRCSRDGKLPLKNWLTGFLLRIKYLINFLVHYFGWYVLVSTILYFHSLLYCNPSFIWHHCTIGDIISLGCMTSLYSGSFDSVYLFKVTYWTYVKSWMHAHFYLHYITRIFLTRTLAVQRKGSRSSYSLISHHHSVG